MDTPAISLLCPDKQEAVFTHCLDCFRRTKAPLPCDVSVKNCSDNYSSNRTIQQKLDIMKKLSDMLLELFDISELLYSHLLLQGVQEESTHHLSQVSESTTHFKT